MSVSASIITGVLSGILTSGLLFLASGLFRRVVLPWYRALVYRGIIVAGDWHVIPLKTTQTGHMSLTQQANRLSGSCTFVSIEGSRGDHEKLRTFEITGTVSDRFVELSLRHTDRSRIGAVLMLLEAVGDGRRLEGIQSMYNVSSRYIDWASVLLIRPDVAFQSSTQLELLGEEHENDEDPPGGASQPADQ